VRAVLVSEFGGPEQLRPGRAADPVAGPGQVRVAVHAAGVNPVDAGNRADRSWAGLRVPCILGYDIAGVIDSVGSGVTGLAAGDRVMAMTHFPDGAGGYAELAVIDAALAAPISPGTSFADAAPRRWPPEPRTWCWPGSACPRGAGCSCSALAAASGCFFSSWRRPPGSGRSGLAAR